MNGPYSIKVKVIHKSNAQTSPNNKTLTYQRITFAYEEGSKTLYYEEIEAYDYEYVIQDSMAYKISNAKLKLMPDNSKQPMIITAWADLASKDCVALNDIAYSYLVVGLTALRLSYRKGFSLSTSNSTFIILDPTGEKAVVLHAWGEANTELIAEKNRLVIEVRLPEIQRTRTTVRRLRDKKANNILQEERHWLDVTLTEFDRKDVRFYLGCSNCGTLKNEDMGVPRGCYFISRMIVTFEAQDETRAYTFTAFTDDAEKLIEAKAPTLYAMPDQEKEDYLIKIEAKIRTKSVYIQVDDAPTTDDWELTWWAMTIPIVFFTMLWSQFKLLPFYELGQSVNSSIL